ncbi:Uncharacterised protein [Acinetobacter baumannii]|nr:Uncharacterised protein [Acinetobacter baumannii]
MVCAVHVKYYRRSLYAFAQDYAYESHRMPQVSDFPHQIV